MGGVPLPAALAARPFTMAEARRAGLRECDVRALDLPAPTYSVRVATPPTSLRQRAEAFAAGLPSDTAFSHVTAAGLLGLPLPAGLEDAPDLDVMRPSTSSQVRRRGCIGHRGLETREVLQLDGLRVVAPADTWCDLGEVLGRGIRHDDLVVLGDAVAMRGSQEDGAPGRGGGSWPDTVPALRSVLASRRSPRGKRALAAALAECRSGSRSPMETRARLMFCRAGFPEPELNAVVRDRAEEWLLEGDLVWREQRVVGEYQGADHASIRRRSADAHRIELAAVEGWTVLELFAEDVRSGPRRRTTLLRFARELALDATTLLIE